MASKVKIITEATELDAYLVATGKAAQSFFDRVQLALSSAVYQAVAHGNTNFLNTAIFLAGKGSRKTAIAQWVLAHAPVVLETDKEKSKDAPFRFSKDRLAEILGMYEGERNEVALLHAETVFGQHWTEHKEPPLVPESWDALAMVRKLLAQGASMQKKKVDVKHAAILASIAAILPTSENDAPAPL